MDHFSTSKLLKIASLFANSEKFQQAEAIYRTCLNRDPNNYEASFRLGLVLVTIGQVAHGLYFLERSVSINPSSIDSYISYSGALIKSR